jgi:hypothetical protein
MAFTFNLELADGTPAAAARRLAGTPIWPARPSLSRPG